MHSTQWIILQRFSFVTKFCDICQFIHFWSRVEFLLWCQTKLLVVFNYFIRVLFRMEKLKWQNCHLDCNREYIDQITTNISNFCRRTFKMLFPLNIWLLQSPFNILWKKLNRYKIDGCGSWEVRSFNLRDEEKDIWFRLIFENFET